jgi:hypothetical protein
LGNTKEIQELLKKILEKLEENKFGNEEDGSDAEEDVDIKGKGRKGTKKQPWYHVSKFYLSFLFYSYFTHSQLFH